MQKAKTRMTTSAMLFLCVLLQAQVVSAATYWVSPRGSDSNACATVSGDTDPGRYRQTIKNGAACLAGGDTLKIKAGTYAELFSDSLPSGLSASQPTVIEGASGEKVIIRPNYTGPRNVFLFNSSRSYITIRNLVIDAVNIANGSTQQSTGMRFVDGGTTPPVYNGWVLEYLEVKNMRGSGLNVGTGFVNGIIRRNKVHDSVGAYNQSSTGIYMRGSNNVIEYNEFYNMPGFGITFTWNDGTTIGNNIARYNYIHNNSFVTGGTGSGAGIFVSEPNMLIHNNVIVNNTLAGIRLYGSGAVNTKIYNNTIWGNGGHGIYASTSEVTNTLIKNNIVFANTGGQIINSGTGTILQNNLTSEPRFVNAAANDFRLQAGSPAIDNGTNLSPTVANDFAGNLRPKGCCYDIGAYEHDGTEFSSVNPPGNLRIAQ